MNNGKAGRVYYLGYYALKNNQDRYMPPSSINKMNYVIEKIVEIGYTVDIISPSQTCCKKIKYFKSNNVKVNERITLHLPCTIGGNGKLHKVFKFSWIFIWTSLKILKLKANDCLIIYHSLDLVIPLNIILKFKKINVILECEEIYNDIYKRKMVSKNKEMKFINSFNAYILPTEILQSKIAFGKTSCVIYGNYKLPNINVDKFDDGKIHIVYSGILDPEKGIKLVLESAKFLNNLYIIHILGYGTVKQIHEINEAIEKANTINSCVIKYEGLIIGNDYNDFLQKCNIGLCTQDSKSKFNNTSFPSKILSYLTNGLSVVSVDIKTLRVSSLNKYLTFYEGDDPKNVATAIINVKQISILELSKSLMELDSLCKCELGNMLKRCKENNGRKNYYEFRGIKN